MGSHSSQSNYLCIYRQLVFVERDVATRARIFKIIPKPVREAVVPLSINIGDADLKVGELLNSGSRWTPCGYQPGASFSRISHPFKWACGQCIGWILFFILLFSLAKLHQGEAVWLALKVLSSNTPCMCAVFSKIPRVYPVVTGYPFAFRAGEADKAKKRSGDPPQLGHCQFKLAL